MARTAKLTVSIPNELIVLAGQVAKERKVSRSKVVSACLQELAEKRRIAEMAEGYKAVAKENKQFAASVLKIAHETLPEWQ